MRDSLSIVDGILVKGEAIVIPSELRASIKKRLHSAHLGCESMKRRARGIVFWPGMAHDIKQLADSYETCQEMKPRNTQEPLKQHNEGDGPWQKIALGLVWELVHSIPHRLKNVRKHKKRHSVY